VGNPPVAGGAEHQVGGAPGRRFERSPGVRDLGEENAVTLRTGDAQRGLRLGRPPDLGVRQLRRIPAFDRDPVFDGVEISNEQFSLNFSKIEFTYQPQADGKVQGCPILAGWDVKANQKI
jgi:hypothetical protein